MTEYLAGSGSSLRQAVDTAATGQPSPDIVTEAVIFLAPAGGNRLIDSRRDPNPRVGDQLHLLQCHRVLREWLPERDRGLAWRQIETETVNVHLRHPVAQCVR